MGASSAVEMDAWLRDGGLVVTASDRAARAILSTYHHNRRQEGLQAWTSPRVYDWHSFARTAWEQRSHNFRLVLSPLQEQALWSGIVTESVFLEGPRRRMASLAMEAHDLICRHAPRFLEHRTRSAWQQDAAAFSEWLDEFDESCRSNQVISPARVPLELISLLESDTAPRSAILLAGFDRLLPIHRKLFEAWGDWRELPPSEPAAEIRSFTAPDPESELRACAAWCRQQLASHPQSRLLVITQDTAKRRGAIERAFLQPDTSGTSLRFEFSLGTPLANVPLARSASMLLRWLSAALAENELDWLLSTGYLGDAYETTALQSYMRALRRRGLERTQWTLQAFLSQPGATSLPQTWTQRIISAQRQLQTEGARELPPLEWAALIPQLLKTAGWLGDRKLSSAEYQATQRFQQIVDSCGSLGFDGRRCSWREFLAELSSVLLETLFAPESEEPPILVAGPAESAGLSADAIWFMGADEDTWPARGSMHPLLPFDIQREARMPHASPQQDWELAAAITTRLIASAQRVTFSFAHQKEGIETQSSRVVIHAAGAPQSLPAELPSPPDHSDQTDCAPDITRIPYRTEAGTLVEVRGGATVLTAQSQCAFKAFATARLGAQRWEPAQPGLSASVRGQLLHAVLHAIWAGPPEGIRSLADLQAIANRGAFVEAHVRRVMADQMPPGAREQMPERYLELEAQRLTSLITEWLNYESTRIAFTVAQTEVDSTATIAGLTLKLRLDRVDRLSDNSLLVVDYKTGDVSPKSWDTPRPDDVQLPLYATFALAPEEELGGLAFAKVRAGDTCLAGRIGDAPSTIFDNLKGTSSLVKSPLTAEQLLDWRDTIEQLARDFLAGNADVNPREYPQTCKRCGLHTICRVQERDLASEPDNEIPELVHE